MPQGVRRPLIRFGIFEVDVASGELRKSGVKIKLQEQPFQALIALVERPRELVTREELQKRLWPSDTNVDFDSGLNKAINRLREALGDEADNPRFIETLPQRGYRFLAQVEATVQPSLSYRRRRYRPVAAGVPRQISRRSALAIGSGLVSAPLLFLGYRFLAFTQPTD